MEQRHRDLVGQGDSLFSKRTGLMNLWQVIAENFYPERANFTATRSVLEGDTAAEDLFSSYPVLACRKLSGLIATMLRPRGTPWFSLHAMDDDLDDRDDVRATLERMTRVQRRAMYDPLAKLIRATKEADRDFVPFGQAVIQCQPNPNMVPPTLLHTCHHLRDCAWSEDVTGVVDVMHRKWRPSARNLKQKFPNSIHENVRRLCEGADADPEREVECRHIVVPTRLYEYETKNGRKAPPFTSLYIDIENEHVMEEVPQDWFGYVVPRWQTVSDSQYARSPATEIALPDARTTQAVVRTLREAGEKFVDPPMIGVGEAIRSDTALYAGGITWVDEAYDERLGEVLRPLTQDKGGMPIGFEIAAALRDDLRQAFFLDVIQLPAVDGGDMTAYEVQRRVAEHVRAAAPLFEPIEQEYSQPLCEQDYAILMKYGAFGDPTAMPEEIRGAEFQYRFESPLQDMEDRGEAAAFGEGLSAVIGPAMQLDPGLRHHAKLDDATRDALRGIGWKAEWIADLDQAMEAKQAEQEAAEAAAAAQALAGAA